MKILKLHMENFQGVGSFDMETHGGDVSIYGDNGVGKSTIFNAFTWLMYGRASTDEKSYTPKTVGTHHLNHVVEMTVELDGTQLTLRKDFHEVYKTKKGNADPVFAGHTSDYSIDGVPVSETDFNARLKEIYKTEELARMLTSYNYFLEDMKIKDRRAKLLEVCGDVDFDSVVNANENLKDFPKILAKPGETDDLYTVEEYQAIASQEKKLIDKKLKDIPGRIDEVIKARPDTEGLVKADLESKLKELNHTRTEMEISPDAALKAEIADAKTAYAAAEADYNRAQNEQMEQMRKEYRKAQEACDEVKRQVDVLSSDLRRQFDNIRHMTESREELLEEFREEKSKTWTGSGVCPTCGQLFPPQYLERVQNEFNIEKSKKLEDIRKRGQQVSESVIEEAKKQSEETDSSLSAKMTELNKAEKLVAEKKKALDSETTPFYDTLEGQQMKAEINDLVLKLKSKETSPEVTGRLDTMIQNVSTKLAQIELAEKQDARKAELEAEEKELAEKYEALSHGLYLCDLYSKTKAELLDDKVNHRFKTLKFRLFIEQQNGGIADDCEALIPIGDRLVPFKSANNAARINAGLEIIDALGEFYGVRLPVYVDNAESNTNIIHTEAQQIRLYVSEGDKVLRVQCSD